MHQSSRRSFFGKSMKALGSLALAPAALSTLFGQQSQAQEKRRAKPGAEAAGGETSLPWVEEGKGMAASLSYASDHSKVKDASKKVERQGTPFEKQHCNACMLYTKVGTKDGKEAGKCTLFQGQLVAGQGFCTSWAKKA